MEVVVEALTQASFSAQRAAYMEHRASWRVDDIDTVFIRYGQSLAYPAETTRAVPDVTAGTASERLMTRATWKPPN